MWPQRACTIPIFGSREVRQRLLQEVLRRNEVGVEDGDEVGLGDLQPGLERAGLVAACDRRGAGS